MRWRSVRVAVRSRGHRGGLWIRGTVLDRGRRLPVLHPAAGTPEAAGEGQCPAGTERHGGPDRRWCRGREPGRRADSALGAVVGRRELPVLRDRGRHPARSPCGERHSGHGPRGGRESALTGGRIPALGLRAPLPGPAGLEHPRLVHRLGHARDATAGTHPAECRAGSHRPGCGGQLRGRRCGRGHQRLGPLRWAVGHRPGRRVFPWCRGRLRGGPGRHRLPASTYMADSRGPGIPAAVPGRRSTALGGWPWEPKVRWKWASGRD